MTSAQNLRQQLNGNRLILLIPLLFVFSSCGIFKTDGSRGTTRDPSTTIKKETVKVYNPETGQYDDVEDPKTIIDTVELKDITDRSTPPIGEIKIKSGDGEMKSAYNVALLFPFNAGKYQYIADQVDPKGKRFIQYYAGSRIAIDDLMNDGIRVNLYVHDTEESINRVKNILSGSDVKNADLIIGPYRRELIQEVASYGKMNRIPVVSPWLPSSNIVDQNPYLVQLTPGLTTHAEKIFEHIESHFPDPDVFIVTRNDPREANRLEIFRQGHENAHQGKGKKPVKIFKVDDNSYDLQNTDMLSIMESPEQAIFVLPYYSRNDEAFVNNFMRKLHAEKLTKEVFVFGLPQWLNFNDLNYDYMESLNVHLSTISYSDVSHPKYTFFKTRFFDRFGIVPDQAAYQGYDLTYYMGKSLDKYGTSFLESITDEHVNMMNLGFEIRPFYANGAAPDRNTMRTPDFFENRGVRILQFRDQDFHLIQ